MKGLGVFFEGKGEVFDAFKEWKISIDNQIEQKSKYLRTKNDLKFCSEEFNNFYKAYGISRY